MSKQTSLSSFFHNPPKRLKFATEGTDNDDDNDNPVQESSSRSLSSDATRPTPPNIPNGPSAQPSSALPEDLSALHEPATQPDLKEFPRTVINGKARSFSAKWYKEFRFLEYSISRDAIFLQSLSPLPKK